MNTIELHQLLGEIRVMNSNIRSFYRGFSSAQELDLLHAHKPQKLQQMGVPKEVSLIVHPHLSSLIRNCSNTKGEGGSCGLARSAQIQPTPSRFLSHFSHTS